MSQPNGPTASDTAELERVASLKRSREQALKLLSDVYDELALLAWELKDTERVAFLDEVRRIGAKPLSVRLLEMDPDGLIGAFREMVAEPHARPDQTNS